MQTLYLVRHTTPDIKPGTCYGQLDVDVARNFTEEAAAISRWLPPVELIITSPLLRTRRLADYLAQHQRCALRTDPRLMEMHFGKWEGKNWNDIARSEIDAWSSDVLHYAPPEGESAQQMMQRVHALLEEISQLPQRQIALVMHGGSIRATLALLAKTPLAHTLSWQIEYGAVIATRFQRDNLTALQTWMPEPD